MRDHRKASTVAAALLLVGALSGCADLMDVKLPAQLTDAALQDPAGATTMMQTVIAQFEDAWDFQVYRAFGREEGGEVYLCGPMCDVSNYITNNPHFVQMAKSLRFAKDLHEKLGTWTTTQVPKKAQYIAMTSIYEGAELGWEGSTLCEVTHAGGKLENPDASLAAADVALTRAIQEITAAGDFAVPYGIASSARQMAYGLRAQVRWFKGDLANAKLDAEQVQQGFIAYNTREAGDRKNKGWESGTGGGFQEVYDPVDWWKGPNNPVNNQPWPTIIPFTGYTYLGIGPDGRAISDTGIPVRTRGNQPPFNTPSNPSANSGVTVGAVLDTRVKHTTAGVIQGKQAAGEVIARYTDEGSDEPLVNWKEMVLIRAEAVGGQGAIDLVNQLRDFDKLPRVTYANPANATQIRYMIIEEKRRALVNEGRFFYTKLRNMDVLWFPRNVGATRARQRAFNGGIRYTMDRTEFVANTNLKVSDMGTVCAQFERPINPL